jgi:hypothetical protein
MSASCFGAKVCDRPIADIAFLFDDFAMNWGRAQTPMMNF